MNEYARTVKDCKIGIKAFQNLNASLFGLNKLLENFESNDEHLKSSYFHYAIIRYAKPFLNSNYENGEQVQYPTKHLKRLAGYAEKMHEHLKLVRNTLVAHDDFEEIEPKLLQLGINLNDWNLLIPTSIVISNKCLSFPKELATIEQMKLHVHTCCVGAHEKLFSDLTKLRDLAISNPQDAIDSVRYTKDYGTIITGADVKNPLPDISNDSWLNTNVPDYSKLHSGYEYEVAKLEKEFPAPEKIMLPDGGWVTINAPAHK